MKTVCESVQMDGMGLNETPTYPKEKKMTYVKYRLRYSYRSDIIRTIPDNIYVAYT